VVSPMERYVTRGNPSCKCAGEKHWPGWYLSVTSGPVGTTGNLMPEEKVDEVRGWIENHRQLKETCDLRSRVDQPRC
jgi:hypothetical protein